MTLISIHQPVYLPWLGFFKKILESEIFVILDDVQYEKNGWHNRNKIKTKDGDMWLTVPVHAKNNIKLNQILIDNNSIWFKKHSKSIFINYKKANFFQQFWNDFELIYEKKFDRLIDLNLEIINLFLKKLDIKTRIVFSSELNILKSGSNRILEICKQLKQHEKTFKIPVVIISTLNKEEDIALAKQMGADKYIGKPYKHI